MSGDIVINDSFEILTPSGWQNFLGLKRSFRSTVKIRFVDNSSFTCTPDHIFIVKKKKKTKASSLMPNDVIFNKRVVSIHLFKVLDVYDPIEVENGNAYYSGGLVSHNCNFLGSSLTLVNSDTIARLTTFPIIYSKDGLDVYEKPIKQVKNESGQITQKAHVYTVIADTAKGVDGDYSAMTVIDVSSVPYKLVAKYRDNKISPMLYPSVIYKVAKEYNDAYVLVEINSSEQVAYILHEEYEYENILFVNRSSNGQVVSAGFGGGRSQLGVITDKKVKRLGCTNFKSLIEENKLLVHDADIISEISTFIERKGSYSADDGYTDDLVMCLVLFGWLTTNPYFKDISDINIRRVLYENRIRSIEEELTPFGFYNDGSTDDVNDNSWLVQ